MSDSKRSKPKNQPQDGTVVQFPTTTEPFSLEAEQSILGGLMFDDSEWSLIQAILSAEDFFLPEHRIIFTAIKSVIAKDQHPDPITLTDHLQAESNFKTIGSNNYLSTLTKTLQQNSVASNLLAYARIVRKLDTLGLCQCSLIIPKEYKKLVDVYAAKSGHKKKEAWTNVIKAGLNALNIS